MKAGLHIYGVTYNGNPPHPKRRESVFFDRGWVASVEIDGYKIDIYSEGETNLRYKAGEDYYYNLCSPSDFIHSDLDSDEKVEAINNHEDYYWINNNWFDLYINGEHLDQVTYTIDEAIESAKALVAEHVVNICFIENEEKPILQKEAILVME